MYRHGEQQTEDADREAVKSESCRDMIILKPNSLPNDVIEIDEEVEPKEHYFECCIFCHYSPSYRLPQFVFHDGGRCTRETEQKYLENVTHKIYLYPDGVLLYKCYDVCELIVGVVCLVHMRRPLYKLR